MTETRLGRQTPTQSVTIPYSKTRGQEAAELYAKTGNELLEWQQLLQCDIMAVNDDGLWMALSNAFGADMATVKENGVRQYPEFRFGASPESLGGMKTSVNKTVYNDTVKDHAIVGDFSSAFKWGFSKEIPLEIIKYGDPDNTGKDLKGYNQVYIRAEVYLGWGILVPEYFARVVDET